MLLLPEHEDPRYWAYTASCNELRGGRHAGTRAEMRRIYPNASRVLSVPDRPNDPWRAEPVASFRRGDILLFHAWFDDAYNAKVKNMYQEAGTP